MAGMTYAQIKTRVINNIRPRATEATYATQCLQAVNLTQKMMADEHDFREMCLLDKTSVDTVASTKEITMPAAVKTIYGLAIEDTTETVWLNIHFRDQIDPNFPYPEGDSTGKPRYGLIWDAVDASDIPCLKVELIPVPDDAYDVHIRYGAWPADFVDTGTEYSAYKNKDHILVAGGSALFASFVGEWDAHYRWTGIYRRMMKEAIRSDKKHNKFTQFQPAFMGARPPADYYARPMWKRKP